MGNSDGDRDEKEGEALLRAIAALETGSPVEGRCLSEEALEELARPGVRLERNAHFESCALCRSRLAYRAGAPDSAPAVPPERLDAIRRAAQRRPHRAFAWQLRRRSPQHLPPARRWAPALAAAVLVLGLSIRVWWPGPGQDPVVALEQFQRGRVSMEPIGVRSARGAVSTSASMRVRIDPDEGVQIRWIPVEAPGPGNAPVGFAVALPVGDVRAEVPETSLAPGFAAPSTSQAGLDATSGTPTRLEAIIERDGDTLTIHIPPGQRWPEIASGPLQLALAVGRQPEEREAAWTTARESVRRAGPDVAGAEARAACEPLPPTRWMLCRIPFAVELEE